jgi:CHAT domain-containing protein
LLAGTRSGSSIDDAMSHATIALSNGDRFTINDIRAAHPTIQLAVLNACYTGGGEAVDGEAAQGITQAFLASGTRNLLVSMWPIRDAAAKQFAVAFHRALMSGMDPAQAAFVSRNELRSSGAPPADWAAFRLVGCD